LVERTLDGGMEILVRQTLARQPLRRSHQGGFVRQVQGIALAPWALGVVAGAVQGHQCFKQIERRGAFVVAFQQGPRFVVAPAGGGRFQQQRGRQGQRCRGLSCQAHEGVDGRAAVALALLLACALDQRAGRLRRHGMGFVKQASGLHFIALGGAAWACSHR